MNAWKELKRSLVGEKEVSQVRKPSEIKNIRDEDDSASGKSSSSSLREGEVDGSSNEGDDEGGDERDNKAEPVLELDLGPAYSRTSGENERTGSDGRRTGER